MSRSTVTEGGITAETFLTSHQAGALIQMNPSSINKWVNAGLIPAHTTPGGHRRIAAGDFVAFLVKHKMPIPKALVMVALPAAVAAKKGKKQ